MDYHSNYFIVASSLEELEKIAASHKDIQAFHGVLITATAPLNSNVSKKIASLRYYDEKIDEKIAAKITSEVHQILATWCCAATGENLARIKGINFSQVLFPSAEILAVSYKRYFYGFHLLFPEGAKIFCSNQLIPNIALVLEEVCLERKLSLTKLNTGNSTVLRKGKGLNLILEIGWRDLSPFFYNRSLKNLIAYWVSNVSNWIIKRTTPPKKSVLIFQTGKMESYFDYKFEHPEGELESIFQLAAFPQKYLKNRKKTFHFHDTFLLPSLQVATLKKTLEENLLKKNLSATLCFILQNNLFLYLQGIHRYYTSVRTQLKILSPDLVLLTAEENELNLLIAQAAKSLNIKTAVTAHGYNIWGYPFNKIGPEAVYDYCFAFGEKDKGDFLEQGVSPERIFITSHPYFKKFQPFLEMSSRPLKKALILPLDFMITGPNIKIGFKYEFINKTIDLLNEMNIEIAGIKVRDARQFEQMGLKNFYSYKNQQIPLYAGYATFNEFAKFSDFAIGPMGTANIESNLMGLPYFTFWPEENPDAVPYICKTSFHILKIATSFLQLKENILKQETYCNGHSVESLIELSHLKRSLSFEQYYDQQILNCIKSFTEQL